MASSLSPCEHFHIRRAGREYRLSTLNQTELTENTDKHICENLQKSLGSVFGDLKLSNLLSPLSLVLLNKGSLTVKQIFKLLYATLPLQKYIFSPLKSRWWMFSFILYQHRETAVTTKTNTREHIIANLLINKFRTL